MEIENQFSIIGNKFIKIVMDIDFDEETNYMPILDVLDVIKIEEGYALDFYKTDKWEYHTLPYVRRIDAERKETGCRIFLKWSDSEKQGVFQHLEIPFTEMGVWQGYLLHILPSITPKRRHAEYHAVEEVYGYEEFLRCLWLSQTENMAENNLEMKKIIETHLIDFLSVKPNHELLSSILKVIGIDTFLPKVAIISDDTATIESLFFSKFGGLVYEATTVIKEGNTLKYQPKDQRVLVKYNCGICY